MKPNLSLLTRAKIAFATALNIYEYPDPAKVFGLSTSLWSGHIDMVLARDRGVKFVLIKFMDGKNIDPLADANYRAAMDAHLLVGGYAWLYASSVVSAGGAARSMLDFLKDHPVHIRPIVDYEWNRINPTAGDLDGFSIPFAAGYGKRPMVYSAPGYTNEFTLPIKFAYDPDWQAQYAHGNSSRMPPWLRWDFLQWSQTGDGAYFGYPPDGEKACELNYWCGTPEELLDFCDVKPSWVDPTPTPEPAPEPTPTPEPPTGMVDAQIWFEKVLYQKWHMQDPHDITYHLVKIHVDDLADVLFDNHVSETSTFLQRFGCQIAINGLDGFTSKRKGRNIITSIIGFAAYRGRSFGKLGPEQTLFISQGLKFMLARPASIWTACSFPNLLLLNGQIQPLNKASDDIRARTAIGITREGDTLILLVVDGGDYWVKVGASFLKTANILLQNGAWMGIMGDGGGSSTLVMQGDSGLPVVINKPSGENADGQRSVAIHMGFKLK